MNKLFLLYAFGTIALAASAGEHYVPVSNTVNGFEIVRRSDPNASSPQRLSEQFEGNNIKVVIDGYSVILNPDTKEAAINDKLYSEYDNNEREALLAQRLVDGKLVIPDTFTYDGVSYTLVEINDFRDMRGLRSVVLPSTLRKIGADSFAACDLRSVDIPASVEDIDYNAFSDNLNLSKVHLGAGLISIDGHSFYNCPMIDKSGVTIDAANPYLYMDGYFTVSRDADSGVITINKDWYYNRTILDDIPEGVESINDDLFAGRKSIRIVQLPSTVKELRPSAFHDCTSLEVFIFNEGLEVINDNVLNNTAIRDLRFPESLISLGILDGLPELQSVYIGAGTEFLGCNRHSDGFRHRIAVNCPKIKTIEINPENKWWCIEDNMVLNKALTFLSGYEFPDVAVIDNIPQSVSMIGKNAFAHNRHSRIILPDNVLHIDEYAFAFTELNTVVDIPWRTVSLADGTFVFSKPEYNIHSIVPPVMNRESYYYEVYIRDGYKFHVPENAVDAYKTAPIWKDFNIIGDLPAHDNVTIVYSHNGNRNTIQNMGVVGPPSEFAIRITREELAAYKGRVISAVGFDNSFSRDTYAFIYKAESGELVAYERPFPIDVNHYNYIRFSEPYVIGDEREDLLIGVGKIDIGCMAYSQLTHPEGNYIRTIGGDGNWIKGFKSGYGVWDIDVLIEGTGDIADARILNADFEPVAIDGLCHAKVTVQNCGTRPIENIELGYTIYPNNGAPARVVRKAADVDNSIPVELFISPKQIIEFEVDIPISSEGDWSLSLNVTKVNGEDDDILCSDIATTEIKEISETNRKVVAELISGTWCPFTPRGYAGFRNMRIAYPDNFIGIILHDDSDMPMPDNYRELLVNYEGMNAVPTALINRDASLQIEPETRFINQAVRNEMYFAVASVEANAEYTAADGSEVAVFTTVEVNPDGAGSDYTIEYVVTEDNVGPYFQNSKYSIEELGLEGSFENMMFNDVCRAFYTPRDISYISEAQVGTTYSSQFRFSLPAGVNPDNVKVVALLVNQGDDIIANADEIKISPYAAVMPQSLSINHESITLGRGEDFTLQAIPFPANADMGVLSWSSSDPSIVVVNNTGTCTALAGGTAFITASTSGGLKAVCEVNVAQGGINDSHLDGVSISVIGNRLHITGTQYAEIFSPQGILLGTCNNAGFTLPSQGVYFVKIQDKVYKIIY